MYPSELDTASSKLLEILGVDINVLSKVKYEEMREYLMALTAVHYSKGHDDGYSMCAGYSRK